MLQTSASRNLTRCAPFVRRTRKSIASATTTTATNAAQSPGVPIVCIDHRPRETKPREPVGRTGPDVSSGRTFAVTGEGLARKPLDWLAHRKIGRAHV